MAILTREEYDKLKKQNKKSTSQPTIMTKSEYDKLDKTQLFSGSVLKKYNESSAKKNLSEKQNQYDNALKQNLQNIKDLNLDYSLKPFSTGTNKTLKTGSTYLPTAENREKIKSNQEIINNSSKVQESRKATTDALNDLRLAQHQYDVAKEENHTPTLWDKTIGVPIRATKDLLSMFSLTSNPSAKLYKDESGNKSFLPTANELRQQNVSNSYDTKVGKLVSDIVYNGTKILGSSAIPGGSVVYWGDMFNDSYVNTINDGYQGNEALLYATLSTASELVTEKLMGGLSKLVPGGNSSLSQTLNKTLSKVMKNDRLRSVLSNALSEGSEEFVQEYVDLLNRNLVLGENNKFDLKTFENALYSGLVGMGTGGLSGAVNVDVNTNNTGIIPQTNKNGIIDVETYVQQLQEAKKAETNQKQINRINETLNQLGVKTNTNNETINQSLPVRTLDFIESARKYNIDSNSETIRSIDNLLNKRNINAMFDESRFSNINTNAFWTIDENGNRNVIFNPNANTNDLLQNVAIHELTHDLLSSKNSAETLNSKEILDFISTKEGYIEARNSLIESYSKVYDPNSAEFQNIIDEEVVASVLGNKLGTQEFVNQLVYEKPTVAKRVLNWIENRINDLKKLVGYTSEKTYWEDVKKRFEKAYKMSYNNTTNQADTRYATVKNNPYGHVKDFVKLEQSIQKDAHIVISPLASKFAGIEESYSVTDINGYTYDFKILEDGDYRVTNVEILKENIKEVANETNPNTNRKYSMENSEQQRNNSSFNNESDRNNRTSEQDVKIPTREQIESQNRLFNQTQKGNNRELDNSSFSFKQKQLDIILENNPMMDDYHTGIRTIDDIKTLEETLNDGEWADYDEFIPDLTKQDVERAINSGKITIYSSYPIEQGIFVSPSKMEAESYSGDGKVYSKLVNINDVAWIDPTQGQYAKVNDVRLSQKSNSWSDFVNKNFKSDGTGQTLQQVKLPTRKDISSVENNTNKSKVLNPLEISNLKQKSANTTPILPTINVSSGKGESKFASNIKNKINMLSDESKNIILSDDDVRYYKEVTNKESLEKAFKRLNEGGESETIRWLTNEEGYDNVDVAEGYILLKQYQDSIAKESDLIKKEQLNRSMVQVTKKLRKIATKTGQTEQAFNILNRLTPEGMVYYAQSELSEAFEIMSKNKTKEWIEANRDNFDITPEETQFIMKTMQEVQQMNDGYEKRVKLAEIQKVMTDKLPPERGAGIKAWMRISMLFNPKTQVRNVMGNAVITPVNYFSDLFSGVVDKAISKKTGVRTIGKTDLKSYLKGFKTGLYQSYNDFKKGINTRNIQGNRFEISQGKSFNDNTKLGKSLNRVDSLLSFMLDAGDRGFYEASFTNSINNQLVLNNTTKVTQEMIDIATQEALSRTWQDNNGYTKFVLQTRSALNKINIKGYGLGDVLIPFAKTPANLTKAIVDYSPAGLVKTIIDGNNLKKSLSNGQYNAQLQHQFVQELGKATAGTMLYILGYALAKAGVVSGESDDDKDTRDFMKNTLGVSSYSIKIGNKSFTYDWAQPISAPLSIMANYVQKQKENASILENAISSLDEGFNIILQQSFFESINNVFSETGEVPEKIIEELLGLPSRAIPTLMKQIVDLTDGTQRQSFEYDQPLKTAINKVKAKVPILSKTLSPSVDTMGREIQKYGGKNNIFNVLFNPANVNTENISDSAKEIYRLYKSTGETNIMPRVAPYYINQSGEKITLNAIQRTEYQKISGSIIETSIADLLKNTKYKNMDDAEKAEVINKIVNYSYNKAREDILDISMSNEYNKINMYISDGGKVSDYYLNKEEVDYSYSYPEKYKTIKQITTYDKYLDYQDKIDNVKDNYDNTNQRKSAVINYVNSLKLSIPQKAMLIKLNYSSYDTYNKQIIEYIVNQKLTATEKSEILTKLGFTVKDGRVYY